MEVILDKNIYDSIRESNEHSWNRHGGATQVERNVNKDGKGDN